MTTQQDGEGNDLTDSEKESDGLTERDDMFANEPYIPTLDSNIHRG